MKNKVLVVAVVLMTLGVILMTSSYTSAQNSSEFTVPLTDPAKRLKLKAQLNYGSITVKGAARKDVLVKYKSGDEPCEDCDEDENENEHRNRNNDESKSKAGLKKIGSGGMDLEVMENNNFVKVSSDSWSTKLNLEIEIPAGADVEVSTYNDGDLIVNNVQGNVVITNYNGEITALNISGSVVATTYNGEIKVTFDKVSDGTLMSFTTYNGDIDLTFPPTLKATLKMKTEQGEIYTGFDVKLTTAGPVQTKSAQSGVYKVKVDDWKRAEVNGGGPEITMKNYNGDIYVRKK